MEVKSTRDIIASHLGEKGINQIEIRPEIVDTLNSEKWIKVSDLLLCLKELEKNKLMVEEAVVMVGNDVFTKKSKTDIVLWSDVVRFFGGVQK